MRKVILYLLGVLTCLIVAALLPIIPIQRAAVIPHPVYSLAFVSIVEFMNPFRMGVWYDIQWYTVVSILALLIGIGVIGIRIARILVKRILDTQKKVSDDL